MYIIFIIMAIIAVVIIYNCLFAIKLKQQTVNLITGGLRSGKTYNAVKMARKLRNRSVLGYLVIGKHPIRFSVVLYLIFQFIIIKVFSSNAEAYLLLNILNILMLIKLIQRRERLKRRFKVRTIYAYFPVFVRGDVDSFEEFCAKLRKLKDKVKQLKELENLTEKETIKLKKIESKIKKLEKLKKKKFLFAKPLTKAMLLGKVRIEERAIVIIDEASLIFPNQNKRSDPVIVWNFKLAGHFYDPSIIMTTQSIGDLDVSVRRVINVVYNVSSFRKLFFFFYKIDCDKINYMEDVITNVNDIKEENHMFLFGWLGPRRYESRYMKKYYKPEEDDVDYEYDTASPEPSEDIVNKWEEYRKAYEGISDTVDNKQELIMLGETNYD